MSDSPFSLTPDRKIHLSIWWWTAIVAVVFIMMVLMLAAGGMVYQRLATARDALNYPAPGSISKVGAIYLHINCIGEGSPTVLLESGIGTWSIFWSKFQNELSKITRVCSYDRAGYGWSENTAGSSAPLKSIKNLHILIQKVSPDTPLLLVGHSSGGLLMRLLAKRYPDDVLGLVLIDSPHEDFVSVYGKVLSHNIDDLYSFLILTTRFGLTRTVYKDDPSLLADYGGSDKDIYRAQISVSSFYETVLRESKQLNRLASMVKKSPDLGSLPVVVVSGRKIYTSMNILPPEYQLGMINSQWRGMQSKLTRISSMSFHIVSTKVESNVLLNDPKLAIAGIKLALSLVEASDADADLNDTDAQK